MVPKNSGLDKYKEIAFSYLANAQAAKIVKARGEDIPFLLEQYQAKGKKAIGLTGEDLYNEYRIKSNGTKLQVLKKINWEDSTTLFGKPALCLLGPRNRKLEELGKDFTVYIAAKYKSTAEKYIKRFEDKGYKFKKIYVNGCIEAIFAGEKFGSKVSGILLGLPIASAISLFFIGFTQTPQIASQASTVMPLTLAGGLVFMVLFTAVFPKAGLKSALLLATISFFAFVLATAAFSKNILANTLIYIFVAAWAFLATRSFRQQKVSSRTKKREILFRAFFAGSIISASVVAAKLSGPEIGGILGAFPASYFSTLLIAAPLHGNDFIKGIVKTLPLSTTSTALYYNIVHFLYPTQGIWIGTVIGYAAAVAWLLGIEKIKRAAKLGMAKM